MVVRRKHPVWRLLNTLSAVSLAACAALLVAWLLISLRGSTVRLLRVEFQGNEYRWFIGEQKLRFDVGPRDWRRRIDLVMRQQWNVVGFRLTRYPLGGGGRLSMFEADIGVLARIAAVGALPCLLRLRRSRRRHKGTARGLCPVFGYDLRTPERCPECGAVAVARSGTAA